MLPAVAGDPALPSLPPQVRPGLQPALGSLLDPPFVDFAEAASAGLPTAPACVWLSLHHFGQECWISPFHVQQGAGFSLSLA